MQPHHHSHTHFTNRLQTTIVLLEPSKPANKNNYKHRRIQTNMIRRTLPFPLLSLQLSSLPSYVDQPTNASIRPTNPRTQGFQTDLIPKPTYYITSTHTHTHTQLYIQYIYLSLQTSFHNNNNHNPESFEFIITIVSCSYSVWWIVILPNWRSVHADVIGG